jgi:hypothetical protein
MYKIGWIAAQVDSGKNLTEIRVTTRNEDGSEREFVLNKNFWTRSLLSPKYKEDFGPIWDKYVAGKAAKAHVLSDLKRTKGFAELCCLFVHDLRKFADNKASQERIMATCHEYFVGYPYFAPETVDKILSLPFGDNTLKDRLDALKEEKAQENSACASHDLAPIYEAAFDVKWAQVKSELKTSKKYIRRLEKHLLKPPQDVLQLKTNRKIGG